MFPSYALDTTRADDAALHFRKVVRIESRIDAHREKSRARDTPAPSPGYSIASVGPADNAGSIFRLRLSERLHFATMRVVVVVPVLVTRASTF